MTKGHRHLVVPAERTRLNARPPPAHDNRRGVRSGDIVRDRDGPLEQRAVRNVERGGSRRRRLLDRNALSGQHRRLGARHAQRRRIAFMIVADAAGRRVQVAHRAVRQSDVRTVRDEQLAAHVHLLPREIEDGHRGGERKAKRFRQNS